jgi:hypothetical protein
MAISLAKKLGDLGQSNGLKNVDSEMLPPYVPK